MKHIKVLVSCCACSKKFYDLVEKVVKEQNIEAEVKMVDDIIEITQYDVMSLPALVVDDVVVAKGQKNENEIIELLK